MEINEFKTDYSLSELAKLNIHFIGIGGSGMSGIARIMLAKGFTVSGSDKMIQQCLPL